MPKQQRLMLNDEPAHDPGGKVYLPMPSHWRNTVEFSDCGRYRYKLSRIWASEQLSPPRMALFVMMNPSTADGTANDPTVAKCCRLAQKWGYDGIYVGNVCAYRSTDKTKIPEIPNVALVMNVAYVLNMAMSSELVIIAHGKMPKHLAEAAKRLTANLKEHFPDKGRVLKLSKDGTPWHPLYMREDVEPQEWK